MVNTAYRNEKLSLISRDKRLTPRKQSGRVLSRPSLTNRTQADTRLDRAELSIFTSVAYYSTSAILRRKKMRRAQKSPTPRKRPQSGNLPYFLQQIAHRATHGATGVKNNLDAIDSEKNIYRPRLAFMQESRAVFIGGDVIREIR